MACMRSRQEWEGRISKGGEGRRFERISIAVRAAAAAVKARLTGHRAYQAIDR